MLVGMQDFDVNDWEKNTVYKNYAKNAKQVQWFWQVCMYLCVYVQCTYCMCVYVCVCAYVQVVHVFTYNVCVNVYSMYVCTYVNLYVCVHIPCCMCLCLYGQNCLVRSTYVLTQVFT